MQQGEGPQSVAAFFISSSIELRAEPGDLFITLLSVFLCVLLLQAALQLLCVWLDGRRFRPPGTLVKLAGRTVHVQQLGRGVPAIVLEAGIAASSLSWSVLQPQLAALAATYSYDRAGLGWSTATSRKCRVSRMAEDLHRWIDAMQVPRPYVLAGHSYAAYILRMYTQRFPDEVAGVVLIDPLTPEEWIKPSGPQRWQIRRAVWFSRAGAVLGALGVIRFCLWLLQRGNNVAPRHVLGAFGANAKDTVERILGELAKLPPETVRLIRERWCRPKFLLTMARYIQTLPACAAEVSGCDIPAHIPVTVISGAHQPRVRMAEHKAIAARSAHGRHLVAANSAHWIHLDQPELIVEAFRAMVEEMKAESIPASH
jgi:pimeloyl-ACP methyl ester carboxylesterase